MVRKAVLTGVDCSGKTEAWRAFGVRFEPDVVLLPEAPTMLLGRLKVPTECTASERVTWQQAVAGMQIVHEQRAEYEALRSNKRVLLCDRALGCGPAYFPGGWTEFTLATGMQVRDVISRYHLVLCFAPPTEAVYNRVMRESDRVPRTYDEIIALAQRTRMAWAEWREVIDIPYMPAFEDKLAIAEEHLARFIRQ